MVAGVFESTRHRVKPVGPTVLNSRTAVGGLTLVSHTRLRATPPAVPRRARTSAKLWPRLSTLMSTIRQTDLTDLRSGW